EPILERLADNIKAALAAHLIAGAPVRANIFVPRRRGMQMVYMANMAGDDDGGLFFPSIAQGITGLCYRYRQPILSNMKDQLFPLGAPDPTVQTHDPYLDQTRGLKLLIRKDRTWLLSVPILDIMEQSVVAPVDADGKETLAVGGPIYGALNVDAAV